MNENRDFIKHCIENNTSFKDYYLIFVKDEIIDHILTEKKSTFDIQDIHHQYQLSARELQKVILMVRKELPKLEYIDRRNSFYELIDRKNMTFHDKNTNGLIIFGNVYLDNLVFSESQARKIASDIYDMYFSLDKKDILEQNIKKYIEEYVENLIVNHNENSDDIESTATVWKNISNPEIFNRVMQGYVGKLQLDQIYRVIDEKENDFITNIDEDDFSIEKDDLSIELLRKRITVDASFVNRNVLNEDDLMWFDEEIDEHLSIAYKEFEEKQKELIYGS